MRLSRRYRPATTNSLVTSTNVTRLTSLHAGKIAILLLAICSTLVDAQQAVLEHEETELKKKFEILLGVSNTESVEFNYHLYKLFEENRIVLAEYRKEAIGALSLAAESGHVQSMYEFGRTFLEDDANDRSIESAVFWLGRASDQGHDRATYLAGRVHYVAYSTSDSDKAGTQHFDDAVSYLLRVICSEEIDDALVVLAIGTYGQLLVRKNFADDMGWLALYTAAKSGNDRSSKAIDILRDVARSAPVGERKDAKVLLAAADFAELNTADKSTDDLVLAFQKRCCQR